MELIDIYTKDEKYVGAADRDVAHAFGLWHKAVHCWIALEDGRVVFQRRSKGKADNPGKLYTTASGHRKAGESSMDALAREVAEEVGARISSPTLLLKTTWTADFKRTDGSDYIDRVIAEIFFCRHEGPLDSFKFKDGEVDGVAAVDIDDFLRLANGEVKSISIQEYDGREIKTISVGEQDFVLTGGETLLTKYAPRLKQIKELF